MSALLILASLLLTPMAPDDAAVVAAQAPLYPLTTCILSGEPLDEPVDVVVEGQLFRTCCKMCAGKVAGKLDTLKPALEAAAVRAQAADYPLDVCVIRGEPLGDAPQELVVEGKLVKVCCKRCVQSVHKDPAAALKIVDAAYVRAQRDDYPLKTCPVSGEPLKAAGNAEMLYGTTLVKLCCNGCVKAYHKDPAAAAGPVLAALAERRAARRTEGAAQDGAADGARRGQGAREGAGR